MRVMVLRSLATVTVLAGALVGLGLAYAPARPPLRAVFTRAGLGTTGDRLFGHGQTPEEAVTRPVSETDSAPPLAPAVSVVRAEIQEFRDQLFVSGSLVPREEALVGPQIDGLRITEVLAEDGDRVRKGDVLARLDRSQLDALLAQSDAALTRADASIAQALNQITQFEAANVQAAADFTRGKRLESGVLSQAALDQRATTARSSEAQLAAARSALAISQADKTSQLAQRRELDVRIARAEVRAPVEGIISRRTARLGALAMSGADPLFRIIAGGQIDLDAEAPDDVLARVHLGMRAKVALQGAEDKVAGSVRLISAEVDKATRLGRVRIALPDEVPARIGSFASAAVEILRRQGVAVPASAVTSRFGKRVVEVVVGDRVEVRPVDLGIVNRETVEVTSGVAAGDVVVARAAAFLRGGDAVRAMPAAREAQL